MGLVLGTKIATALAASSSSTTHTVSFRPEQGHTYDVANNGTLLIVTDNTTGHMVLYEWSPIGCSQNPHATKTKQKEVLLEFQCFELFE